MPFGLFAYFRGRLTRGNTSYQHRTGCDGLFPVEEVARGSVRDGQHQPEVNSMASDTREKEWGQISDLYCSLLEDTAEKVRTMRTVPNAITRKELLAQIRKIDHAGRMFQDCLKQSDPADFSSIGGRRVG